MDMIAGYVHANCLVLPEAYTIISILVVLPFPTLLASTEILSFSFPDPHSLQATQNVSLSGDASPSKNGIEITVNALNTVLNSSSGWATFYEPLQLWDHATGRVADFTSNFSFVIQSVSQEHFGDGMTFFLTPNGSVINKYAAGGYFALTNSTNKTYDGSYPPFIAVEFDTFTIPDWDPDYVHVGIYVDTIYSKVGARWDWNKITTGGKVNASVVYNSIQQILSVMMIDADNASSFSTLKYSINLRDHLPEWVTFGFSASTGDYNETHTIHSWNFISSLEVQDPPAPLVKKKNSYWQWIIVGVGSFLLLCLVLGFLWSRGQSRRNRGNGSEVAPMREPSHQGEVAQTEEPSPHQSEDEQTEEPSSHQREDEQMPEPFYGEHRWPTTPRKFSFNQLATATNYFSIDRLLGKGGCGEVYEGHLREGNYKVAIKKFTREYTRGIREFRTEVTTISQLRHKNLVQLFGLCHENEQLLLIYELMPNGSLYDHLFEGKSLLTWKMRYQIAQGLAWALHYLHVECIQCVLHRDIKANNVMLDSDFNAKLGDFGLARIVDHAKGSKTTVCAGTWGYMAPDSFHRGKVTKESDMYSFGIVMLEIASGKKVIHPTDDDFRLVDWIWGLYGTSRLLEAVDPKLINYDPSQMKRLMVVGLWCAHPDSSSRPTITAALSVLKGEASPPDLPPTPPVPTFAITQVNEPIHRTI